jgi:O-antigen/teichoic acid export membrane protein
MGLYGALFAGVTMLGRLIGFLLLPVYTRYLSPADYGVIELVNLSLDLISIFAGTRLIGGMFRYYHKATNTEGKLTVVSTTVVIITAGYLVVGLVCITGAAIIARVALGDPKFAPIVRLAAFSLLTQSLIIVPLAFLRLRNRFRIVIGASLIKLIVQVSANVLLLARFGFGTRAPFVSTLIGNLSVGIVLTVIVWREVGWRVSRPVARDLYRYGAPLVLMQLATFILTFGDRYFLRRASDLASVGRYTLAYQFAFLLVVIAQAPFELVWDPKKFEVAKRPDRDSLFAQVFVYVNVVLLTAAVGIALFASVVIHVMTQPAFYGASAFVPLLLCGIVFQVWVQQDIGLAVRERTELIATANFISAGVILVAYAVLIPRFAGWGAATATIIGYAVRWGLAYRWSQQLWPIRYQWRPVLRLVALAAATVGIGLALPSTPVLPATLERAGLFAAYLFALWHADVLSTSDRAVVRGALATAATIGRQRIGTA